MSVVLAFVYGFSTAVIGVIAVLIYAFAKVKEVSSQQLADTVQRIQGSKEAVDASAKLDSIRLTSNVVICFGSGDGAAQSQPDGGTPTSSSGPPLVPGAKDVVQWSRWSNARLVLLGTTITVYETLATADAGAHGTHGVGAATNKLAVMTSSTTQGPSTVTAERFLGKMSTSLLSYRVLLLEDIVFLFADPLTLTTSSTASATSVPTTKSAEGSAGRSASRLSAVVSAATALHRAMNSTGSITDKNAEDWLKANIEGKTLFLEQNAAKSTATSPATQQASSAIPATPPSSGSIFLHSISKPLGSTAASTGTSLPPAVSSMLLVFSTRRELDRWANVLAANEATFEWKQYVRSLPSLDVLNLLAARIFFENSSGPAVSDMIKKKIAQKLRHVVLPKPLTGHVEVSQVVAGGEVPLIHNVSFASFSTSGEIGFDFDLHYRGGFRVVFAASFFVKTIRIPQLLFRVHLLEIGGRVHVSIGPPPTNKFWIGFHAPPSVRIEFVQEVASHEGVLNSLLSLVPDLSETISNFVKVELFEDMLLPNMECYELPNVGAESSSDSEDDGGVDGGTTSRDGDWTIVHGASSSAGKGGSAPETMSSADSRPNAAVRLRSRKHRDASVRSGLPELIQQKLQAAALALQQQEAPWQQRSPPVSAPDGVADTQSWHKTLLSSAGVVGHFPQPQAVATEESVTPTKQTPILRSASDGARYRHAGTVYDTWSLPPVEEDSHPERSPAMRAEVAPALPQHRATTPPPHRDDATDGSSSVKKQVDVLRGVLAQKAADVKKAQQRSDGALGEQIPDEASQPRLDSAPSFTSSGGLTQRRAGGTYQQPQWRNPSF